MFIGSGIAFGLTPEPVISDGHHSGAERGSPMEVLLVIVAVGAGVYLFRRLRARPAH
jgi:hypothetical protein